MKYFKSFTVCFLILLLFTSCGNKKTDYDICVISTYPHLEGLSEGSYSSDPNSPYKDCRCVVSEFYGNLLITDKISYGNAISGVTDKKSFGNYWGDETGFFHQDEDGNNEIITTESFIGMIPCVQGDALIAVTGGIYGGNLHLIVCEQNPEDHRTVSLVGMPKAFSYTDAVPMGTDSRYFYIATETALLRVDASEYLNGNMSAEIHVQKYDVPKYWKQLEINSMCQIGDMLYMGTQTGVLSFHEELKRYTYYPVDYETAICGESD
ncbi:MAG: hypothetical protein IJA86_06770 [Clostridia bacterium]|nr:hypothetical protein [Clostridia bacterium]